MKKLFIVVTVAVLGAVSCSSPETTESTIYDSTRSVTDTGMTRIDTANLNRTDTMRTDTTAH